MKTRIITYYSTTISEKNVSYAHYIDHKIYMIFSFFLALRVPPFRVEKIPEEKTCGTMQCLASVNYAANYTNKSA